MNAGRNEPMLVMGTFLHQILNKKNRHKVKNSMPGMK